jgi:hypothetical protein
MNKPLLLGLSAGQIQACPLTFSLVRWYQPAAMKILCKCHATGFTYIFTTGW